MVLPFMVTLKLTFQLLRNLTKQPSVHDNLATNYYLFAFYP